MASGVKYRCDGCGLVWTSVEQDTRFKNKLHDACVKDPKGHWQPIVPVARVEEVVDDGPDDEAVDRFRNGWDTFVWDRGGKRGHAVVGVESHELSGVNLEADYGGESFWMLSETLVKQVEAGQIFLANPPQVLELLIRQLRRQERTAQSEELMTSLVRAHDLYVEHAKTHPPVRGRHKRPQMSF